MHRAQLAWILTTMCMYSGEAISASEKKEEVVSPVLPRAMAYQDIRTETNTLTPCFVRPAALWPILAGCSRICVSVSQLRRHALFHKTFTQLQHLRKSFGPWIITMFGLSHPHTHTHCPHTMRWVYICLCWTCSPLSAHLSGSKTVKLVANSGPELSRF